MSEFQPRPGQDQVLAYQGGKMGISAVPGSGKTRTLAELAAILVAEKIEADQEVLVVTLVNSAVDNFKRQINQSIKKRGLLPGFGYRVRTLHGLAHDIVRERPGLVGLSDDFGIIDERQAEGVREDAAEAWLRGHPDAFEPYLSAEVEGDRADWLRRARWPSLVRDVATAFIKRAKDLQLTPEVLLERLAQTEAQLPGPAGLPALPLARMGGEIYADYQRSLAYRGEVDFDDLIRLALEAIQRDGDYLARLQQRWPYVLEDEAQDSSELQEEILRRLTEPAEGSDQGGNWVRVGDPNQAIYETFTNADPRYLTDFLEEEGVTEVRLLQSGRSQPAIIALANQLVDWTYNQHPKQDVQGAFLVQHIEPTGPGDPQPNPAEDPSAVKLILREYTPDAELLAVVDSVEQWVQTQAARLVDERETCAVLAPRNQRGFQVIDLLKRRELPHVELLRSTSVTRQTAGALGNLLRCLADPTSARKLSLAFRVWRREDRDEPQAWAAVERIAKRIAGCPAVEAYLWPRADHDWLASLSSKLPAEEQALLAGFREAACRWHRAAELPIDQLVLTLAGDLVQGPVELALAHKLAVLLRDVAAAHPTYRLAELVEELAIIARNERRFLGFASEESGFEPPRGEVTVATMHKAKGLEWDRVYLMAVNNYNFPSGLGGDSYIAEPWFLRDNLNLEAEALAQLAVLASPQNPIPNTEPPAGHQVPVIEGTATQAARLSYVAERLRLLYVGITRAKHALIVTWNTGRRRGEKLQPAVPFVALHSERQERNDDAA